MTTYKFYVTKDDIARGMSHMTSIGQCPVARSMSRTLNRRVFVGTSVGHFSNGLTTIDFCLPPHVEIFIRTLCRYEHVEPISFELALPI